MSAGQTTWAPNFRDCIPPERRGLPKQECEPYLVRLTDEERWRLIEMTVTGTAAANNIKRARILLRADKNGLGWSDARIARTLRCAPGTVYSVRRRMKERGLNAALENPRTLRTKAIGAKLLALLDQDP